MEEKLSLFDSGMIELNKDFEAFTEYYKEVIDSWWPEKSKTFVTTSLATYNWDENKITLSIMIYLDTNDVEDRKLKDFSKMMFEALQSHFMIDSTTGKPFNNLFDKMSEFFSHQGYQKKDEPPTLQAEVHNLMNVVISFGTTPAKLFFKVSGKLYGTELLYSK
jgi:hypothetical protein